jgi:hypothetical protein
MEKSSGSKLINFFAAKFPVGRMAEATDEEKARLLKLLSNYQLGLLSEAETQELSRLQKKVYGDSIMYRDSTI